MIPTVHIYKWCCNNSFNSYNGIMTDKEKSLLDLRIEIQYILQQYKSDINIEWSCGNIWYYYDIPYWYNNTNTYISPNPVNILFYMWNN